MSAFGPYAQVETIDFTQLESNNIFLITGPTGAGKTTIFDGISYAIYGRTSGRDRQQDHLKSDFASEDRLSYVELEFELHGQRYYIKRIPTQLKKKVRGEGFTEQKTEVELKLLDEDRVITGVDDVNHKVTETMGITYEQFRQIMMIPQGEFRELLLAESKQREAIFRKIFGTEAYERVQRVLDDMAGKVYREVSKLLERRNTNIKNITPDQNQHLSHLIQEDKVNSAGVIEELEKHISVCKAVEAEYETKIKWLHDRGDTLQQELTRGQQTNEKFRLKSEIEKEKEALEKQQDDISALAHQVDKGRTAQALYGIEENVTKSKNTVELRRKEIEQAVEKITKAKAAIEAAERLFRIEEAKESDRKKRLGDIAVYKSLEDKVQQYEQKQAELIGRNEKLQKKSKELNELKGCIENLKLQVKQVEATIEEARRASKEYVKVYSEYEKKTEIKRKLDELLPNLQALDDIRKNYKKQVQVTSDIKTKLGTQKKLYEEMQDRFYKGYAGILAEELKDKMPCPVCGSDHHPSPAIFINGVPTQEDLNTQRKMLNEWEEQYNKNFQKAEQWKAEGNAKKQLVDALRSGLIGILDEEISSLEKEEMTQFIEEKVKILTNELNGLQKEYELLDKKQKLEAKAVEEVAHKSHQIELAVQKQDACHMEYTHLLAEVQSEAKIIENSTIELPEEIRTQKALQEKIHKMEKDLKVLEDQWKKAQKQYEEATNIYTKAVSDKESVEKMSQEAVEEMIKLEAQFDIEIIRLQFKDRKEYFEAKRESEALAKMDEAVKEYHATVKSNKDRYKQLISEIKDLCRVDLNEIQIQLETIRAEQKELSDKKTDLFANNKHNIDILNKIQELTKEIEVLEQEYRVVGDLAKVARGDNSQRLTFERYVLAAYFDDIIQAANIRLGKMTGNRYEMNRIKEKGKGSAQSGLEIEVMDHYTGKARHAKTLSGGESFKASLALALGLADIVQANAGGITLETIFIDEGFGTLDVESLDNAIQCLIELQNLGRLVGIISHVQELKDRIQAKLEIQTGITGSKTRFIIG